MTSKHPHYWGSTRLARPIIRPDLPLEDRYYQCSRCGCYLCYLRIDGKKSIAIYFDRNGNEISRGDGNRRNTPHCLNGKPVSVEKLISPMASQLALKFMEELSVLSESDQHHIYLFLHSKVKNYRS
jgi:hypothetical protein